MILIAIGTLTLLSSIVILWRRAVETRVIRWQLYQLRDNLRRLAVEDRALLESDIFRIMDARLTASCAKLEEVSIWTVLPYLLFENRERIEAKQRHFITRLNQPQHAALVPIYERSSELMAQQLAWRHIFISVVALVTIVGVWGCHACGTWLARRILSDAMRPVSAPIVTSHAVVA